MKLKELLEGKESVEDINKTVYMHGKFVDDDFYFYDDIKKLTSLEGSPAVVGGSFYATDNLLTSMIGCPEHIGGSAFFGHNKITSIEGAPKHIKGGLYLEPNKITSLEGIHKQINFIGGRLNLLNNPIKSHILGVLLIDGLKVINLDDKKIETIINKYLKGSRDVMDCQNELMDAGLDEYAQL